MIKRSLFDLFLKAFIDSETASAACLLQELNLEQMGKAKVHPDFNPGDAIEVHHLSNVTTGFVHKIKGVVIAKKNRVLGSNFTIRNVSKKQNAIILIFSYVFRLHGKKL